MQHSPVDATSPTPYLGFERRERTPFLTMRLSLFDVYETADFLLTNHRTPAQGVGLFVTPNIQHISDMRGDREFAAAMRGAQLVVCDGFPVYRYAQWRGYPVPERVAGRDVIERMMARPARLARHRLFFVVDSEETAHAIRAWTNVNTPAAAVETVVPPFGYDERYAAGLAERIREFETSLLFLCIGAPRSELFVHRHRAQLPPCWALCVGQSFKIALGLTAPPPAMMVKLHLEWLWRIVLEPRRMLRRYGPSSLGFLAAVAVDLVRNRPWRSDG